MPGPYRGSLPRAREAGITPIGPELPTAAENPAPPRPDSKDSTVLLLDFAVSRPPGLEAFAVAGETPRSEFLS